MFFFLEKNEPKSAKKFWHNPLRIEGARSPGSVFEYWEQVPFWIVTWRGQNFNEEKLSGGNQGKEVAVTTPNWTPGYRHLTLTKLDKKFSSGNYRFRGNFMRNIDPAT